MKEKYKERVTLLTYKGNPVYEVTKQLAEHTTIVDLCEKYLNEKGEECYRKIYY